MMKPWLDETGPVLDLLGKAVRKPTFFMPMVRSEPAATLNESVIFGQLLRMRAFARSLEARANYRLGIGDMEGAMYDAITEKRLGRHLQRHATFVVFLVGISIEGIADSIGIAAVRERPPTAEQLRRFGAELQNVPRPLEMERLELGERYATLDWLQAVADGKRSLAETFPDEWFSPGSAQKLPLDWNVVMRRVNARYNVLDDETYGFPYPQLTVGNLFIGVRSRHVADCLVSLHLPSYQAVAETRRRTICSNNLRRIALAMLLYQHEHGALPPAYTVDANGKPLHSWRVLLLPYIGEEKLSAQIRLDEPWDSAHNRQFHDTAVAVYQCPSALRGRGQTAYSVAVGPHTAFQPGQGKPLDAFGTNLILVVERCKLACWMEPTSELTEPIASEGVHRRPREADGIRSQHPGGALAARRDGSTRFLAGSLEPVAVQSLLDGTAKEPPP